MCFRAAIRTGLATPNFPQPERPDLVVLAVLIEGCMVNECRAATGAPDSSRFGWYPG